jgi:hypothetical protein
VCQAPTTDAERLAEQLGVQRWVTAEPG